MGTCCPHAGSRIASYFGSLLGGLTNSMASFNSIQSFTRCMCNSVQFLLFRWREGSQEMVLRFPHASLLSPDHGIEEDKTGHVAFLIFQASRFRSQAPIPRGLHEAGAASDHCSSMAPP